MNFRSEENAMDGMYDHMNSKPVSLGLTIDDLARFVEAENYGCQRMLCALVRARRVGKRGPEQDVWTDRLEQLVRDGFW
jgi:hypothetical protein